MNNQSHKLVIDITDEQFDKLRSICPHGTKKQLFQSLIESLIELHDTQGTLALMNIIRQQDIGFKELIRYDRSDKKVTDDFTSLLSELLTLVGLPEVPLTTYSECVSALAMIKRKIGG